MIGLHLWLIYLFIRSERALLVADNSLISDNSLLQT